MNFYLGGIMVEEQGQRVELIKRKLIQKVRFKKVRRAMKKWQQ